MKRLFSIIAICMIVVLCVPSVPSYAATFQYRFLTSDSVADFWEDATDNTLQSKIIRQDNTKIMSDLHYFQTYETQLQFFCSNYDQYLIGYAGQGNSTFALSNDFIIFGCPSDVICVYYYTSINSSSWINNYCFVSDHAFSVYYNRFGQNYDLGSGNLSTLNATLNNEYYVAWVSAANMMQSVCSGDCPVYSFGAYADPFGQKIKDTWDNRASLSNFNSGQIPFVDDQGEVVDPSVPEVEYESNSNHMYFQNCDFGFCEPKGISSYNQFGGAYIYCRYVVDDWIVNHISDYSLQISMETLLDNQRYFRTLNYPLDRDGCLTLPFKNFGLTGADNVTQGFVVVGNSSQTIDTDYFKVNLYSITTEQSKQEWFDNAARTYNTVKAIDIYDTYDFSDVQDFYESNVAKYNKFTINLRAVLVSGEDNSGPVARSFNLVTGTDIATDTTGFDNENPFVPDDSSEDYTPSLPSDTNTTVPSIIVNTGGTWQGTFNGKIGYDPGYTDLKLDVNKDPDGNFTQYLNPMKNQTFGSWFFSFLDDMPGEMKALLIAGTGVGIFFGLYRFIRRG